MPGDIGAQKILFEGKEFVLAPLPDILGKRRPASRFGAGVFVKIIEEISAGL